ncbi:hypothetical protein Tco_0751649 [Tanacetum coccineum]|uniref:AT-hook motif nuclear-localized protein n=1 Tax=Tanacetum coccineum TaxID=301880 RepID=A0ABQ4Z4N2_9ASTR
MEKSDKLNVGEGTAGNQGVVAYGASCDGTPKAIPLTIVGDLDVLTNDIEAENTNVDVIPCDDSTIVHSVSFQQRANSYVGVAGVFSEDGISIIASYIGTPIMLDSYTRSMCIESWGRISFARCLIEVSADDVFKDTLTMGVPLIEDSGFSIEMAIVTPPSKEKANDGFQTVYDPKAVKSVSKTGASNVGNTSKSGMSHVSSMSKTQPFKAGFPTSSSRRSFIIEEGGNIIMSNSYASLDDESEEEIDNVYDESGNLFNSTKTGGRLSTFTVAAG